MTERLPKVDSSSIVAEKRRAIINSILTKGLKSSRLLTKQNEPYFGSGDYEPRDFVSFRLIIPPTLHADPKIFSVNLENVLYLRGISVLPVMTERKVIRDPLFASLGDLYVPTITQEKIVKNGTKHALEKRIASSFLIVICDTIDNLTKKGGHFFHTSEEEKLMHLEYRGRPKEEEIPPNRFSYLLFPKAIWEQYKNGQIELSSSGNGAKIKVVKRTIERKLFERKITLTVPDYEGSLLEILRDHKEPIWVHGVRLPTKEDL